MHIIFVVRRLWLRFLFFSCSNIFSFGTSVFSLSTIINYVLQSANTEFELQQVRCDSDLSNWPYYYTCKSPHVLPLGRSCYRSCNCTMTNCLLRDDPNFSANGRSSCGLCLRNYIIFSYLDYVYQGPGALLYALKAWKGKTIRNSTMSKWSSLIQNTT